MENSIKKIISAVLEISLEEINEKTSSETIKFWDSLKHMNLIIALEEEFNIEFEDDEIVEMNSYLKICSAIKNKR